MLNIALVGCGNIGLKRLNIISKDPDCKLIIIIEKEKKITLQMHELKIFPKN